MLGVSLLFVGIVLVSNGILFMSKVKKEKVLENGDKKTELVPLVVESPKSIAFFNVIVGALLLIGNFIMLVHAPNQVNDPYGLPNYVIFNNIAAGMVFGVTYIFLAGNLLFKLDMRPFGWFSVGASLFALIMTGYNFYWLAFNALDGFGLNIDFLILGILWFIWFILWFTGVLQFIFKIKAMEKIFPPTSIVIGIIGAFIPAIMLLLGIWPLL